MGKINYTFTIEPELIERLKEQAERDRRSVSMEITVAIEKLLSSSDVKQPTQ